MLDPRILNTLGLLAAIVGCVLLYRFGLPEPISQDGSVPKTIGWLRDEAAIAKAQVYRRRGRWGIGLIGFGAVLQIAAIWLG